MNTTKPVVMDAYKNHSSTSNASSADTEVFADYMQRWPEFKTAAELWIAGGIIIIVIGTIGHALAILAFLGSKKMRSTPVTVYLVANSAAGLAAIYVGLLRQVTLHKTYFDIDLRDQTSDFGCRLHVLLSYMSLQLFSWLEAMIAVERAIAVTRPLHYKRWCTWRRNLIYVVVVVGLLTVCNVIVALVYQKNEEGRCSESQDHLQLFRGLWGYVDLILYSLFPVCIIVPCNAITLKSICNSQRASDANERKYLQVTVMLVIQNFFCVATTLPISVIFLAPWPTEVSSDAGARRELEWTIVSLLQYLGTTFSFVIYTTSARRFRRALLGVFLRGFNANILSVTASSRLRESGSDANWLRPDHAAATEPPQEKHSSIELQPNSRGIREFTM